MLVIYQQNPVGRVILILRTSAPLVEAHTDGTRWVETHGLLFPTIQVGHAPVKTRTKMSRIVGAEGRRGRRALDPPGRRHHLALTLPLTLTFADTLPHCGRWGHREAGRRRGGGGDGDGDGDVVVSPADKAGQQRRRRRRRFGERAVALGEQVSVGRGGGGREGEGTGRI